MAPVKKATLVRVQGQHGGAGRCPLQQRGRGKTLFLADCRVASGRSISLSTDWPQQLCGHPEPSIWSPAHRPLTPKPASVTRTAGQSQGGASHDLAPSDRELGGAFQGRKPMGGSSPNRPMDKLRKSTPPGLAGADVTGGEGRDHQYVLFHCQEEVLISPLPFTPKGPCSPHRPRGL